jgi:hypothetical protein
MPIVTQMGDLTATLGGSGVEVDGPGTARLFLDMDGNVVDSSVQLDDDVYPRMVAYGARVLSGAVKL